MQFSRSYRNAAAYLFLLLFIPNVPEAQEMELRVMTFNIWYGCDQVSFSQCANVIRAANPDLIGVQEPDGNLRQLAVQAGYTYVDERRNIISRYPLFDPDTSQQSYPYTYALIHPGRIVAFANTHLTSSPFGPDMLRDKIDPKEVMANEMQARVPEVVPYASALKEVVSRNIPVFFAGDFNTPSHEDNKELEWPVTKILADAGLRDSFREAHPDASKTPGITYTPGYPHPYLKAEESLDRIDMIWSGGKTTTLKSEIIGERNNPAVSIAIDPYPSDHRAVVSTFRVNPAPAGAMITVEPRSLREGAEFLVRFQTPGFADWGLAVVPRGKDAAKEAVIRIPGPIPFSYRSTMKLASLDFAPGAYDAILLDGKGGELTRTSFYVLAKDAVPELKLPKNEYKAGEAITVSFSNAPGMKNDWIGVYAAGDRDLYGGYKSFKYTGAKVEGTVTLEPLPPGEYELRLLREDSYVMLASIRLRVL